VPADGLANERTPVRSFASRRTGELGMEGCRRRWDTPGHGYGLADIGPCVLMSARGPLLLVALGKGMAEGGVVLAVLVAEKKGSGGGGGGGGDVSTAMIPLGEGRVWCLGGGSAAEQVNSTLRGWKDSLSN